MKIVFFTGILEKNLNANSKIVCDIAQSLCAMGYQCTVTGMSLDEPPPPETVNGVKRIYLNSKHPCDFAAQAIDDFFLGRERNLKNKIVFLLCHPVHSAVLFYCYKILKRNFFRIEVYRKEVKELMKSENPDVAVRVYNPFLQTAETIKAAGEKRGKIVYQLDPYGLHEGKEWPDSARARCEREAAVFEKADTVITTPVLLEQYKNTPAYKNCVPKMRRMDFPCVFPYAGTDGRKSVFDFDENYINILFCGRIHDRYRDPSRAIEAAEKARETFPYIRMYFLGKIESDAVRRRIAEKDWIFSHPNVSHEERLATMEKSDALLNISNLYSNQVPSKIFEYFALGKPILNIRLIENCPAKAYIDRYPLSFTLDGWENVTDETAAALRDFLKGAKNKRVDFDIVKEIYKENTLEHGVKLFASVIEKVQKSHG